MALSNVSYVSARAKTRRKQLASDSQIRALISQSPEQISVSVGDIHQRLREDLDRFAGIYSGGDLVEAALSHNLEKELNSIFNLCAGKVKNHLSVFTQRYQYQNAKSVLRAVFNEVDVEKVEHDILPNIDQINAPWLDFVEKSETLRDAVVNMKKMPYGKVLMALPEDSTLAQYEDALDMHYYAIASSAIKGNGPDVKMLQDLIAMEIDHKNILNILEANAVGYQDKLDQILIPGGKLLPKRSFQSIISGKRAGMLEVLAKSSRFDSEGFAEVLQECEESFSLDPAVTWLKEREYAHMSRMSYLHPVSSLPVVHYVSMKVKEISDLRLVVRGRLAGLSSEVLEAHILGA